MAAKKRAVKKKTAVKPAARLPARTQPETLRLRTVTTSFTVNDLQRSIAFYRDVLGFWVGEEWREKGLLRGVELKAGAMTFMLDQDDFAKGRDRKKGVGFRLWCGTAQDVDRFAAEIKARGGMLDEEPHDMPGAGGQRLFTIVDPDGFKMSFVQER